MKLLHSILIFLFLGVSHLYSQVPHAIPYQAVSRDSAGNLLANQAISVRFSIHDSIPTGTIVYQEIHSTVTNVLGLFTLNIGQGTVTIGSFAAINWGINAKFLQVEMDPQAGSNFIDMGTTQMLSVPYALYSEKSLFSETSGFNGVLYDKDLMIISTHNSDTVFRVDTLGRSVHKGRELFFKGIWVFDTLVVLDTLGNPVFRVNPDGTSFHKGEEWFRGGITVGDSTGSISQIKPDGTIEMKDTSGNTMFKVNPDGTSFHAGLETFKGGINVGDSSGAIVKIHPDGTIEVADTSGNTKFKISPDGSSFHAGLETFAGGVQVGDSTGAITKINPNGSIEVADTSGNTRFRINPDGSIEIADSSGNTKFKVNADGTSFHAGQEHFANGITVGDSANSIFRVNPDGSIEIADANGNVFFEISPNGTSYHKGVEFFDAGIIIGNNSGYGELWIYPDGTIEMHDSTGAVTYRQNTNGTSYHKGLETFDGGIEVRDSNGVQTFKVNPDGTSYHKGEEHFEGGIIIGTPFPFGPNIELAADGYIFVRDSAGNMVFGVSPDGNSYHKGHESFEGGIEVGSLTGSRTNISPDGTITVRDSNGVLTFRVNPDGTSFHKGVENFQGGIVVKDTAGTTKFQVDPYGNIYSEAFTELKGGLGIGNIYGAGTTLYSDGTIIVRDADLNTVFQINPDGTSYHKGLETFAGGIEITGGTITGDGSGLNSLNAGGITLGTLFDDVLSPNVALKNTDNFFSGQQEINVAGGTALTCTAPLTGNAGVFNGTVIVNGGPAGAALQAGSPGGIAATFDGSVSVSGGAGGDAALTSMNVIPGGLAGLFNGNVSVQGDLEVTGTVIKGGGTFRIDHPLDPENKYLSHSFVEAEEMMNIYSGNCELDEMGRSEVAMPEWFEALNKDFRYQLTCVGGYAPVYIEKEISGNSFVIAGGKKGMKVSWQVTAVRNDAYANKYRVKVEEEKPADKKGTLLHPEAFSNH